MINPLRHPNITATSQVTGKYCLTYITHRVLPTTTVPGATLADVDNGLGFGLMGKSRDEEDGGQQKNGFIHNLSLL